MRAQQSQRRCNRNASSRWDGRNHWANCPTAGLLSAPFKPAEKPLAIQ
jgi:hypothetical protein